MRSRTPQLTAALQDWPEVSAEPPPILYYSAPIPMTWAQPSCRSGGGLLLLLIQIIVMMMMMIIIMIIDNYYLVPRTGFSRTGFMDVGVCIIHFHSLGASQKMFSCMLVYYVFW